MSPGNRSRPTQPLRAGPTPCSVQRLRLPVSERLAAGADTCLFLTGEAQKSDLPGTAFPPDYVLDGPADLLRILNSAPDDFQDL